MDRLRERWQTAVERVRRLERRELREFRAWLETTRNLIHLTVLLVVPLLIALVTALSNTTSLLPFVLFPPLASGTYTLFSDPEGRYASPTRFIGGLTVGAICGAFAVFLTQVGGVPGGGTLTNISPMAAALAIFLTGAATWAFDLEEPSAFSTALLALIAPAFTEQGPTVGILSLYVTSVFVATSLVASVFYLWRERFYERRAEFLYQSTNGDDHVLVPIRGETPESTVMLAARLAAAHDAGKVVLLDVVESEDVADAEQELLAETHDTDSELAEQRATAESAATLESLAGRVETKVGVPCEVVVAVAATTRAQTVLTAAHETNCDLIVTPYEERHGALSPFVHDLFRGDTDVLVHRSGGETPRTAWRNVLVPVRRASDAAHAMVDFAMRLAGKTGLVSLCHCVAPRGDRRRAESMLADLVETTRGNVETRIARESIETFLTANASSFDLVILGASTDRSKASRFVSPPTFERLQELECDVAIVDLNYRY